MIFVLYLKKLNHKGRKWLLWPFCLVCGPRGNGRPQPALVGSRENSMLLFSQNTCWWPQQHLHVTWVSVSPRVQWWGHTGPAMVSVSGKNVHLSHELLTHFKANSTTLILRGNKYMAYGCPPWSILHISLFRKQSLLSDDYQFSPLPALPVVTQQTAEGFWDFPLEQGCCQVLQCIIGGNDTQTGFRWKLPKSDLPATCLASYKASLTVPECVRVTCPGRATARRS